MRAACFIALALLCGGCAHQAQHIAAPDASRLQASARRLATSVVASKAAVADASRAVKEAKAGHDAEAARIAVIEPKVSDLLRVAPLELRPAVTQIQDEVFALHGEHETTAHALDSALAAQAIATGKLEEATAAKNESERFQSEYTAAVDKLTEKANAAELAWAKDSKELLYLKAHRLMGWILMIAGFALCGLFAFLKLTGRLAAASSIV